MQRVERELVVHGLLGEDGRHHLVDVQQLRLAPGGGRRCSLGEGISPVIRVIRVIKVSKVIRVIRVIRVSRVLGVPQCSAQQNVDTTPIYPRG